MMDFDNSSVELLASSTITFVSYWLVSKHLIEY
jgi:hypothetical protein